MKQSIRIQVIAWLGSLGVATLAVHADSTMTFDSLTPDFSTYSSYSESGLTLSATTAGNHFYAVSTPDLSSTAAQIFSLDGAPQQLSAGGSLFNFKSIDIVQIDSGVTVNFIGSNGSTASSSSAGTVTFGSAFNNEQWVKIQFGATPAGVIDSSFVIDNLTVVPEPAEWTAISAALCGVAAAVVRSRRNRTA